MALVRVTTRRSPELTVASWISAAESSVPSRATSVTFAVSLLPAAPALDEVNRAGSATFFSVRPGMTWSSTHASFSGRSLATRMRAPRSGVSDAFTTTTPTGPSFMRPATRDGTSTSRSLTNAGAGAGTSFAASRPRPTENRNSLLPAFSFTGMRTNPHEYGSPPRGSSFTKTLPCPDASSSMTRSAGLSTVA